MSFTGGSEVTPTVTVARYVMPGSLHNGDVTLRIDQYGRYVYLSPETMKEILKWYGEET
jgi:hypothetical protein